MIALMATGLISILVLAVAAMLAILDWVIRNSTPIVDGDVTPDHHMLRTVCAPSQSSRDGQRRK
ncbi:hypothetical protein [Thalassovita mediterranea]|jgi:hypothetical protein|uniref:Uncharacterized protein n=1 Tax=Thalassovita mediterranea TaxID=340021 RepID=A0A0P1GLZ9_9RHOB|nr:hypothetical protein [Thalassovita mediterranea]CUH83420.1 hypothetical protein TM5383_00608 [Thalassovita mediterranea]SIS34856.1 hypothetical protein SAMN05421685_1136 [Thalassovita mediterranea]